MLISISDYEELLNEDLSALDDDYVESILECVSEDLELWLGRSFSVATQVTDTVQVKVAEYGGAPVLQAWASRGPVQSIDSLSVYVAPGTATVIDVSDAIFDAAGVVRIPFGRFGTYQPLYGKQGYQGTLTYTIGGDDVPAAIKRAVALLAQEMLNLDDGSAYNAALFGDVDSFSIGDYSEKKSTRNLEASQGLGLGSANAVLAARLAVRYKVQGVILV